VRGYFTTCEMSALHAPRELGTSHEASGVALRATVRCYRSTLQPAAVPAATVSKIKKQTQLKARLKRKSMSENPDVTFDAFGAFSSTRKTG
jgi:hypothetical protein